ncbi:hypothetical protein BH10CYA1_BH10CYA1_56860 [soil metagenome]
MRSVSEKFSKARSEREERQKDPSVHYLEGEELRAFRQLRRDHPDSDFVFNSQRQGLLSSRRVHRIIARASEADGETGGICASALRLAAQGFSAARSAIGMK